jgi:tripartite-type tricarboxylate transporter receptor subunit TctC
MSARLTRRTALGAALALPFLGHARAETYPSRPIRLLCPYPPGATNDNTARTMGQALTKRLGQPVVVENRAGAGGAVGARTVADAKADGYSLLNVSAANLTIAPYLNRVGYDPLKSFTPIAMAGEAYAIVGVNPELPVRSLAELVEYGRRNPGVLNYASPGIGSVGHLRGALLADAGGIDAVHVPFPGSAAAAISTLAGDCHIMIDPAVAPLVEAGQLRGLAVVGASRWDAFPDLPSLAELGIGEGWPGSGWFGLLGPAGTPAPIVTRLNQAFNDALAEPEVAAALRRFGLRVEPLSPEELGQRIAADHAAVGRALDRLRIA